MVDNHQLFALAAWLQTFPEFDLVIYNGNETPKDLERLQAVLNTTHAAEYVYRDLLHGPVFSFLTYCVFNLQRCLKGCGRDLRSVSRLRARKIAVAQSLEWN